MKNKNLFAVLSLLLISIASSAYGGTISYTGNVLTIDMGYQWMEHVVTPAGYTEVQGCFLSRRQGIDLWHSDLNQHNDGICVNPETDSSGNTVFRAFDNQPNDNLPVNDLFNNDEMAFIFKGKLNGTPIEYWQPVTEFEQGPGVRLDYARNRLQYGNYRQPTIELVGNSLRIWFNTDGLAPVKGKTPASKNLVNNEGGVKFLLRTTSSFPEVLSGDIAKDAKSGDYYAVIPNVYYGMCGSVSVDIVGGDGWLANSLSGDFSEVPNQGVWALVGGLSKDTSGELFDVYGICL